MGWGPQRGAALVAPATLRHTAGIAKERAEIMKERRKLGEDLKLRAAPRKTPKGQKGGGKGAGSEPPE